MKALALALLLFAADTEPPFDPLDSKEMQAVQGSWDAYQQVFAEYRSLEKSPRPKSDDEKRDQWMVRMSRTVGHNLGPFFDAWGVPVSDEAKQSVAELPLWMPDGWETAENNG